jgi:hypothetical protein
MSTPKPHKHAPWSKGVLITLWVFQLALSLYQFAWALTLLMYSLLHLANPTNFPSLVAVAESDFGSSHYDFAALALNLVLGFFLSIYIILTIVKFAKFKLTSVQFQKQSVVAVIMGLLGLVLSLADRDFFNSIMVGSELLVSIGICIYVIVIRRRVMRGVLGEMKRPGTGEIELEGGRQEVPSVESRGSKDLTTVRSPQAAGRPSFSSARTAGEVGGPEREPREFL